MMKSVHSDHRGPGQSQNRRVHREVGMVRRLFHGESGVAVVEFAIAATVLFSLVFGIIQTCFALYTYNYVSDAARAATRYAMVRGSSCSGMSDCGITSAQIQTYVQGAAYPGINSSKLSASATWLSASATEPTTWTACEDQCNAPGNAVQVTVTYAVPVFLPYWKHGTINVSSTSQMVISN